MVLLSCGRFELLPLLEWFSAFTAANQGNFAKLAKTKSVLYVFHREMWGRMLGKLQRRVHVR